MAAPDHTAEDIAFARLWHKQTIDSRSALWPTIGKLQRAGLMRVRAITKQLAELTAVGAAAPENKP